jgi:hypothetical protein
MDAIGKLPLHMGACALLITLSSATAVMAGEELVGRWKVVSLVQEEYATGGGAKTLVTQARGEAVFTADGHYMMAVLPAGCDAAVREAQPATVVHAGRYRISGDKLIQTVELASNAAWIGSTRTQFIDPVGDRLVLESMTMPAGTEGERQAVTMTLEREP